MGLLRQPVHGAGHAVHEEGFRRFLATMTIGVATNSSALGTASVANRSGKIGLKERRSQT